MDDAEAEAVLLALGPRLEWEWNFHGYSDCLGTSTHKGIYMISTDGQHNPIRCRFKGNPDEGAIFYTAVTNELAKAACERHLAMGKWE